MNWPLRVWHPGVVAAIGSAILFGAGTPLAKLLLGSMSPWLLAGLLYLGSGIGLTFYRLAINAPSVRLVGNEVGWFGLAILFGGIIAPVLLLLGLSNMPASGASLLLNAEGVFTALLAWFVFKENFDRRIALGMFAILLGAVVLSWNADARLDRFFPALAILGACLSWAIDNNLTRKVSLADASWLASMKGLVAGIVNLGLTFLIGGVMSSLPSLPRMLTAMVLGFLAYGVSLSLFVIGLRHLGTARTGAYFSVAPFIGAALALLLGEPISSQLLLAALLMVFGLWLHLTEDHKHSHEHLFLEHDHEHVPDEHHDHPHEPSHVGLNESSNKEGKHSHKHQHLPISHSHSHFPDAHHQHRH
jgi:drug/metabolite transporter (DMT)-like permease